MRKLQKGFTLVEVLVASSVFTIISITVVSVLFIVLRNTKKSDSVTIVKQNGEQAMTQMVRVLRFTKSLDEPSSCDGTPQTQIKITATDLIKSSLTCPTLLQNYIGLNGVKLTNDAVVTVGSCSFVCSMLENSSPIINISFSLSKINLSGLPEEDTIIPFQSSVNLRNIDGQ